MPRKTRRSRLSGLGQTKCFNTRDGRVCFETKKKTKRSSVGRALQGLGDCKRTKVNPKTGCTIMVCRVPKSENPTGYQFQAGTTQCKARFSGTRRRRARR